MRAAYRSRTCWIVDGNHAPYLRAYAAKNWTWRAPPPPPPRCHRGALLTELQAHGADRTRTGISGRATRPASALPLHLALPSLDSAGIEPAAHPCEGCVIPLHYEPDIGAEGIEPPKARFQTG